MDDSDRHRHPEPDRTKIRTPGMGKDEAKKWLDEGGHLEAPEEALYRHMRESQRRLMVMLPTALWVGVTHLRENLGYDFSEDLQIALERSAGIAVKYLVPVTAEATVNTIMKDAQALIVSMNADSMPQAVTGLCHLITALADQERIPDPTAQAVLVALGVLTEAENDAHAGVKGTWAYDEAKLQRMANKGIERLEMSGYL